MLGSGDNYFRFVGIVKGRPKSTITKKNTKIINFILCVKDVFLKKDVVDIRCITFGSTSEKCIQWCQDGNVVAVSGGVMEVTRRVLKKQINTSIAFVVTDIILLKQVQKKKLSDKELKDILNTYTFEV